MNSNHIIIRFAVLDNLHDIGILQYIIYWYEETYKVVGVFLYFPIDKVIDSIDILLQYATYSTYQNKLPPIDIQTLI